MDSWSSMTRIVVIGPASLPCADTATQAFSTLVAEGGKGVYWRNDQMKTPPTGPGSTEYLGILRESGPNRGFALGIKVYDIRYTPLLLGYCIFIGLRAGSSTDESYLGAA